MNMNSPRPKPVAEINLEEFERRLRASVATQAGVEDPLAELTRLVDTIGLERSPSERALEYGRAPRPAPAPPPPPVAGAPPRAPAPAGARPAPPAPPPRAGAPPPPRAPAPAVERRAPPPPPPPPVELRAPPPPPVELRAPPPPPVELRVPSPPPPAAPELEPFAFDETQPEFEEAPPPPLRDVEPLLRPALDAEDFEALAFEPRSPAASPEIAAPVAPQFEASPIARSPRPRNWGLKVGGLLAAAAVMAGAVVVFKVGGHSRSGAPPLILASTAPTKVAPPSDDTVRTDNESGSLLTHDTAQAKATPPKLVDTPEAPVDLSARPPATPNAADASPVAPANDTQIVANATPTATPMSPVGADPSRVKTISVRPDGTLISSSYQSADAAPAPTPSPTPAPPAAATSDKPQVATTDTDGEASSPAVALPTKLSPPKSGARVVGKTDTTAPADAGAGPVPTTPKPKKPKPKPTPAADADVAKTDDAQAAPAVASGGYAVQLAAPRSEDEAKSQIRSLQSKYADALGGASLGVRKADRHGEAIYRVRAGGLSKADAAAMCAKIKSAGGDCFVAKN
jgi:hypothetical protein